MQLQEAWAELWVRGLQASALKAAAQRVAAGAQDSSGQTRPEAMVVGSKCSQHYPSQLEPAAGSAAGHMGDNNSISSSQLSGSAAASMAPAAADVADLSAPGQGGAAPSAAAAPATTATAPVATGGFRGALTALGRRRDVAEQCLRHGLACMAEAEDFEWLGVRQSRWKAYQR